ncbi:MAG: hypothetical protein Q9160_009360 [Pyrenula sp. 1 TL-2023]
MSVAAPVYRHPHFNEGARANAAGAAGGDGGGDPPGGRPPHQPQNVPEDAPDVGLESAGHGRGSENHARNNYSLPGINTPSTAYAFGRAISSGGGRGQGRRQQRNQQRNQRRLQQQQQQQQQYPGRMDQD